MAISTLTVNANNDLYLADGSNLVIVSGLEAVQQGVDQATKERLGENPFNVNEGVDYFGTVFSATPDYVAFRDELTRAALSITDVTQITSVILSKQENTVLYSLTAKTLYSEVTIQGAVQ